MSRIRFSINNQWRYAPGGAEPAFAADFDDRSWEVVNLPHTWNAADAFEKTSTYRRGVGWYRKSLTLDAALRGGRLFLHFEGANQVATVWINGRHAGSHAGGTTAFAVDVTDLVRFDRANTIAVSVDNSYDPDIPPLSGDFNFYGGIHRNVWLLATPALHIAVMDYASTGVFVTPLGDSVRIHGGAVNRSGAAVAARVVNEIIDEAGAIVASDVFEVAVAADDTAAFDRTVPVAGPRLWSPAEPYLYRVRTRLSGIGAFADEVENPLGFRSFSIDPDRGLTLNGKPLRLFGTNRHQDVEGLGNAVPDELQRRDLNLIRENGFNFVRLAHYPQAPVVLDEADRLGLVVWEEIPVVNRITMTPAFTANAERMLTEMIRQHYNHPSIFFWGLMNEVLQERPDPLTAEYRQSILSLARKLNATAHAEDPARPTAIAMSRDEVESERELAAVSDVVGMNLYFGWYYGECGDLGPFIDGVHRRDPSRPLVVSEYGAGSDERVHSARPRAFDFSSEYGQQFHRDSFPQMEDRPFLIATAVWNQFDFGSSVRDDTKPGINSKGLFLYDRTPRDAALYYRAALRAEPMLKLAREWQRRAGSAVQPVRLYTNQPQAELLVNGRSAGTRRIENRTASWDVALSPGENRIVARAGQLEDAITIRFERGFSFAINAGADIIYDSSSGLWEPDRGYAGGHATTTHHRIFGTGDDPLYQSVRAGAERYRFDVPDGAYEATLGFVEYEAKPGERVFSIHINGREVVRALDIAAVHGPYTAASKSARCIAAGGEGITIEFHALRGEAAIAAIQIAALGPATDNC